MKNLEKPQKKKDLIQKFHELTYKYLEILTALKSNYCFLIFDEHNNLLSVKYKTGIIENRNEYRDFFTPGVSYCEKSIGTNAVSIANTIKKPIYVHPRFHYCNKLKIWHEYCIPIKIDGYISGYLLVISIKHPIPKAVEGFLDLMGMNIENQCSIENGDNCLEYSLINHLTDKQNMIIKMIAQGLSDETISQELDLSLATVKYHNQAIFRKLNANSRVDAVVKALIANEITISDLFV